MKGTGWGCDTIEPEEVVNTEEITTEGIEYKRPITTTESNEESIIPNDSNKQDNMPHDEVKEERPVTDDNDEIEKESVINENNQGLETDESGKPIYTSEWLKKNTNIRGWLAFFLFSMTIGGIISAIYPIVTYNADNYAGSLWLGSIDILIGIGLFVIAIYTLYAFSKRIPNSVFYAKLYVILILVTNVITVIGGDDTGFGGMKQAFRGIAWGGIWLFYLLLSKQVKEIIPIPFRKISKIDWGVLCAIIVVPFFCFGMGMISLNSEVEKREKLEEEIRKVKLANNERTDGRIIFAIPIGFECQSEDVEPMPGAKITLFTISNESIGNCYICSDYDSDTSKHNFDDYWNSWENENDKMLPKENVARGSIIINENHCMYRIVRYNVSGVHVYWKFYILFDSQSGKCCVASFYDRIESAKYVNDILESIRFK